MKLKKITALLLSSALMLTLFAGCSSGNSASPAASSASPSASADASKRTITDMAGREVEVPATVNKVATIGATARMLTYAGCADKIVGLTDLEKSATRACRTAM